jgi:hypothetical protein
MPFSRFCHSVLEQILRTLIFILSNVFFILSYLINKFNFILNLFYIHLFTDISYIKRRDMKITLFFDWYRPYLYKIYKFWQITFLTTHHKHFVIPILFNYLFLCIKFQCTQKNRKRNSIGYTNLMTRYRIMYFKSLNHQLTLFLSLFHHENIFFICHVLKS